MGNIHGLWSSILCQMLFMGQRWKPLLYMEFGIDDALLADSKLAIVMQTKSD